MLAVAILALTIVDVPIPGPLPLRMEQSRLHALVDRIGAVGHGAAAAIGRAWLPAAPARGGGGIAIQRSGWRIANDPEAIAWTEAPQRLGSLARQRFRWAFGTLQCLWKHRAVLREGRPRGLALIGMPQAWLFQILFSLVSPMIDLALLLSIVTTWGRVVQHGWAQTHSDVGEIAFFWLLFAAVDLACGWIAFRMDVRERRFPALLLIAQRFVYRQLMYWVVIKAVSAALHGRWVGWGKLERTGRAMAPA